MGPPGSRWSWVKGFFLQSCPLALRLSLRGQMIDFFFATARAPRLLKLFVPEEYLLFTASIERKRVLGSTHVLALGNCLSGKIVSFSDQGSAGKGS